MYFDVVGAKKFIKHNFLHSVRPFNTNGFADVLYIIFMWIGNFYIPRNLGI